MARPLKDKTDRRTKRVEIRLTEAEEKTLSGLAESVGLTVSDHVRKLALGCKPTRQMATPERQALIKGLAELGKIGSNVNQIAKALNTSLATGQNPTVQGGLIAEAQNAIQSLSTHLIKQLTNGY
jgi:Bacterial mobilisation protein (MobC)